MFLFHIYISIFVILFPLSWTNTIEIDDGWPWVKTKYLTRTNWTSLLKANNNATKLHHPVWFIYNYLSYCGYCKLAQPGWEAIAGYAEGWSRYIKVGAYDCANEEKSESDICQDGGYPQWRIFCPTTNSTQLVFDANRTNAGTRPEDILVWSIKKINKIAHQCYGKSWPIRELIKPDTYEHLNRMIPKHINKFQLFVSDSILHYSIYVLNNSKTVFKEPIYRLEPTNSIKPGYGIWKGTKNDDGEILLEPIPYSTESMKSFELDINVAAVAQQKQREPIGSIKPTTKDIDSAVVWMINKDLRRKLPALYEDVKSWLNTLHTYYPGSDTMKSYLNDLIGFLNDHHNVTSKEFQNYTNSLSKIKLPEITFDHCNGSDSTKRGYTCTLWVLFHSMTVKQAALAEENKLPSNVKPTDLLVSIREFVQKFFLCAECVQHFTNMTANVENEIDSFKENVLYLWRAHNKVNKRLRNVETSTDPAWPKVPFPTKQQCDACVRQVDQNGDAEIYDENETFSYLKDYYHLLQYDSVDKHLSGKKSQATNQRFNHLSLSLLLVSYTLYAIV